MARSMTGFGRAITAYAEEQITVEVSAVNHRFLESSFRLPPAWASLEAPLRELVKQEIQTILSLGVDLRCNMRLGRDFSIASLRKEGYKAIFLGIGLPKGRKLPIPGADAEGVYRGQCTQYCGVQHAHMGLEVVAQSETEFLKWEDNQRRSTKTVTAIDSDINVGKKLFLDRCSGCHTIRGTEAVGAHANNNMPPNREQ